MWAQRTEAPAEGLETGEEELKPHWTYEFGELSSSSGAPPQAGQAPPLSGLEFLIYEMRWGQDQSAGFYPIDRKQTDEAQNSQALCRVRPI